MPDKLNSIQNRILSVMIHCFLILFNNSPLFCAEKRGNRWQTFDIHILSSTCIVFWKMCTRLRSKSIINWYIIIRHGQWHDLCNANSIYILIKWQNPGKLKNPLNYVPDEMTLLHFSRWWEQHMEIQFHCIKYCILLIN